MQCLQIFCYASRSKIQCYRQTKKPIPSLLENQGWDWIQLSQIFKFLSIPFPFQASSKEVWEVVIERVVNKIEQCLASPMALATKFLIYTKVLIATHVYYFSSYAPSLSTYHKLEKTLRSFLWVNNASRKGSYGVNWELCCTP
jgi:hypothetical protein